MYKCEYCSKEFKTERGLKQHYDVYCDKIKKDTIEDKSIEEMTKEDIEDLLIDSSVTKETNILDKLIKFFDNVNLDSIHLRGEKFNEFKLLYKEYYKKDISKLCADGLVHAYSTLYYTTKKLQRENEKEKSK